VIGLAATLIGGYPIFKEAFENISERRMTMELRSWTPSALHWLP
jgi:cation transport ATPase